MKLLSSLSLTLLPAACLAAIEYQCPLPDAAKKFSAIVLEDMDSAAHNVYTGVAVGGVFKNTKKPNSNIAVDGESFVGSVQTPIRINWNKGINTGSTLEDAGIDWSYFEYMAKNTFSTTRNGYKIVRMTSGGNFNTYSFNNGGQGEDNGKTIVFFDTTDRVVLKKTNDGRQFGPTIIAPFSVVRVHGNAGFVDGLIVAKKLITSGGNPSQLQLHGDYFKGNDLPCRNPPPSDATSGPTAEPTGTPTPVPTSGPTLDPTSSPTAGPTETPPTVDGGAKGDPHFKTWKNEHYEYHGQCDMILVQDPDFANGLGIEVQIRTKLVRHWSYIKNAAIRIGEDVLEVEGSADPSSKFQYWYNFESRAKVDTFAGFPLTIKHRAGSNYTAGLEIDLSSMFPGEKIVVATWKEFVRVDFKNPTEASFGKSVGLLGDFHTGETLARDGITVHNDFWTYGNEWQVLPNEFMLFHVVEQPQFPKKCIEPEDPQGERRRRLEVTGKERIRRRPERHVSKHTKQKTTPRDAALEGHFTLIDIAVEDEGLLARIPGKRYNAIGTFCKIEWKKQQENPSTVPMFKDLQAQSFMCEGTQVEVDLFDLAQDARAYDASFNDPDVFTGKKSVVLPVEPAGLVFHETRCGSTLTANLLAAFSPDHSRVYSESPPPVHALRACSDRPCDPDKHTQLIKDVFYLMGRTLRVDRPQHVFYKIQSIGTMDIDKFTSVFPNTPWVYLYRDSVEVMMSHFKDAAAQTLNKKGKERLPVCARNYVRPMNRQPRTTQKILQKHDKTMDNIGVAEYCAAHLAALSLAAIDEHKKTGMGRFINYNQLPEIAWDRILPEFFDINPISDGMIENMKQVAGVYSKGRNSKANQVWQEDATNKHNRATPQVIAAAHEFLSDIYDQMENLSKS